MSDPGITDTAFYHESVAGDNGARPVSGTWWLSPDIALTSAGGQADFADPAPAQNHITVKVHRKDASVPVEDGKTQVLVDLFVCDPTIAVDPPHAVQIPLSPPGFTINPQLPANGANSININWVVPSTVTAGHHCMIIRSRPNGETPDPGSFHVADDQHYAQHNICIINCNACNFDVQDVNIDDRPRKATVRVIADRAPSRQLLSVVIPRLQRAGVLKGPMDPTLLRSGQAFVQRFAPTPPRGFNLRMPDFPRAVVRDNSANPENGYFFGRQRHPTWEADIDMGPRQRTRFQFRADLRGSKSGDIHIFHLTHTAGRTVQGGITLVAVEA